MPSGTPSNRSQLLLSFVAIRRDSCEGSSRTSTANAERARQLGRSRQQGKGDTFLCGRRGHLPYQKMTAFFGLGGIGWSSIWIQNSDGGQIVESTPSRPRCYYLALKADAGSVPCSATIRIKASEQSGAFLFAPQNQSSPQFQRGRLTCLPRLFRTECSVIVTDACPGCICAWRISCALYRTGPGQVAGAHVAAPRC